jgi:hypothetical protein
LTNLKAKVAIQIVKETVMPSPGVGYMGAVILPIVEHTSLGFTSMAVIVDFDGNQRGSGALGSFETEVEAWNCAVEFGTLEIERRCLMTLPS